MATMEPQISPEDQAHQALDTEISNIQQQIQSLKSRRQHLTSILLSTPDLPSKLGLQTPPNPTTASLDRDPTLSPRNRTFLKQYSAQHRLNLTSTHRLCTGLTAFRVQNPDPHAENGGKMLGIQVESFDASVGRYEEGYVVLFDVVRDGKTGAEGLRLARHTVPGCLRVERLVRVWLGGKGGGEGLQRFARGLRRVVVGWRGRCRGVERLRERAGVREGEARREVEGVGWEVMNGYREREGRDEDEDSLIDDEEEEEEQGRRGRGRRKEDGPTRFVEIYANPEVRNLYLAWSDGTTAILEIAEDGEVVKGIARCKNGTKGKLWDLERRFPGHIDQLYTRLASYTGAT